MPDITDQLQEFKPASAAPVPTLDVTDSLREHKDIADSLKEADQLDLGDVEEFKKNKDAFNPVAYANANPNVFKDPKKTSKLLDIWKNQQDISTDWGKVAKEAGKAITGESEVKPGEKPKVGIGIQILHGAKDLLTRIGVATTPQEEGRPMEAQKAVEEARKKAAAELVAGTESAGTGLADLARTGGRKLHMVGKKYADLSDQEALQMLMHDAEFAKQTEKVASGEGETMQAIGLDADTLKKEGITLDTDAIQRLSLVDPITIVATGGVFKVVGVGGKILGTAATRLGAEKVLDGLAKLGAKGIKAAGAGIEKTAEKVKEVLPISTHGVGAAALLHMVGVPKGMIAGARIGAAIAKPVGRTIRQFGETALGEAPEVGGQKLMPFAVEPSAGENIYNAIKASTPVVKPIAKGVASGVVGSAPFVAAAPTEEAKGQFLGAGTLLGAAHGVLGIPGEVVGRTYFDPRNVPFEARESNPYGTSAGLDAAHESAMKSLPANDRNAINNFREELRDHGHEIYAVDNDTYRNILRDDAVRAFTEAEGKPPTPEDLKGIEGELESRGIEKVRVQGDSGGTHEVTLINASHPKAIFHEAGHLFERSLNDTKRQELMASAEKFYSPEQLDNLAADISNRLQRERPLDMSNPEDKDFVLREVIAEGYNTLFQNRGLELTRKPGLWRDLARSAAEGAEALGVLPTGGRTTPGLQIKPSVRLQEHLRRMGEEVQKGPTYPEPEPSLVKPEEIKPTEPAAPAPETEKPTTPFSKPIRTGPRDVSAQRAEETNQPVADKWAADKPNKEAVAEVGKALDENVGLKVEHRGAPVETFNATEPERAAEVEAGRGLPPNAREMHGKTLRPTRWEMTKSGEPQLVGRSGDKVLSNIDRAVQWMNKSGEKLPWATDTTGRLTPEGLSELMTDLNSYWDNQDRGFRGGGKELVRPSEELGASIPQQKGEGIPLSDEKEQFLNLLQGKDIGPPETVRAGKGLPANIKASDIRRAQGLKTEPIVGRELQVYPAKVTGGRGEVPLQETNPLRNKLRAAGFPVEQLHTVVERLNASDIIRAEKAPELKGRGGSTDIARAGFLPGESHRGSMSVRDYAEHIFGLSAPDFKTETQKWGGLTNEAWRLGLSLTDRSELATLKEYMDRASADSKNLISSGDFDNAIPSVMKAQFYREAWEAAQGTKSAGVGLKMKYPGEDIKFPFPDEEKSFLPPDKTEIEKVRSGENFGQTFNADGTVADIEGKDIDIVTIASKNIPRDRLTPEVVNQFISQYPELIKLPEFKAGVFNLEKPEGKPLTSIDLNVAVPQEHRANTLEFAQKNNQQGIWDAKEGKVIDTGGTGETRLQNSKEIVDAAKKVIAGEKAFLPKAKDESLPSYFDTPEQGTISSMSADLVRTRGVTDQFWLNAKTGKILLAPEGHVEAARDLGGIPSGGTGPEIYDAMDNKGWIRGVDFGASSIYLNGSGELSPEALRTMEDVAATANKNVLYNDKRVVKRETAATGPEINKAVQAGIDRAKTSLSADEKRKAIASGIPSEKNYLPKSKRDRELEQQARLASAQKQKDVESTDYSKYEVPAEPAATDEPPVNTVEPKDPLTVYHFGTSDNIQVTQPSRMKKEVHGFWGEIPKTFFFVGGSEANPGSQFSNRSVYKAVVDKSKLYDASQKGDPLDFFRPNRSEADAAIREAGYQGVIVPIKGGKKVVVMYDPVSVEPAGQTDAGGKFKAQYLPPEEAQSFKGFEEPSPEQRAKILATRKISKIKEQSPEAILPKYTREEDGSLSLTPEGKPRPVTIEYNLAETPLAKEAAKGKRGAERESAISEALGNELVKFYKTASKNPEISAGSKWYSTARVRLKKIFGNDAKFFAELLGATSARTPVETNFRFALDAYNQFKTGEYDSIIDKYREGKNAWDSGKIQDFIKDTKNEDPTRGQFLDWWIDKHDLSPVQSNGKKFGMNSRSVLRVLDGSWKSEVKGPKTPNFAGNLTGQTFDATVDVWAARALHRLANLKNEKRWRILPENETGVTDADFYLGQAAYRHAAEKLGIKPDALQAVLWFAEKNEWEKNGWTRGAGAEKSDFNKLLEGVEQTPEGIVKQKSPQKELAFLPSESDVIPVKKGQHAVWYQTNGEKKDVTVLETVDESHVRVLIPLRGSDRVETRTVSKQSLDFEVNPRK